MRGDDLRLADVRARHELVDQVARHALLEAATAAKYRDAARMVCEEERRLSGRVAGSDEVDVKSVDTRRFAARRTVEDALAREPVETFNGEVPPRDPAGEDDRPPTQDIAAVQVQPPGGGVDPRDRPCYENLRAQPPRLLQRAPGELVARHA